MICCLWSIWTICLSRTASVTWVSWCFTQQRALIWDYTWLLGRGRLVTWVWVALLGVSWGVVQDSRLYWVNSGLRISCRPNESVQVSCFPVVWMTPKPFGGSLMPWAINWLWVVLEVAVSTCLHDQPIVRLSLPGQTVTWALLYPIVFRVEECVVISVGPAQARKLCVVHHYTKHCLLSTQHLRWSGFFDCGPDGLELVTRRTHRSGV